MGGQTCPSLRLLQVVCLLLAFVATTEQLCNFQLPRARLFCGGLALESVLGKNVSRLARSMSTLNMMPMFIHPHSNFRGNKEN